MKKIKIPDKQAKAYCKLMEFMKNPPRPIRRDEWVGFKNGKLKIFRLTKRMTGK